MLYVCTQKCFYKGKLYRPTDIVEFESEDDLFRDKLGNVICFEPLEDHIAEPEPIVKIKRRPRKTVTSE